MEHTCMENKEEPPARPDVAVVFPGQGSQYPGMGKDLYDAFEEVRGVFDEASHAIGRDMARLCFDGAGEELDLTINTQISVFTVNMAAFRVFQKHCRLKPAFMAGHSLGEYAALTASGAATLSEMLPLVLARATFMHEAVPPGSGAMAAIVGMEGAALEKLCREVSGAGETVSPANLNGPGQMVISGTAGAVEEVAKRATAGGGRAIKLPISVPCHCSLLDSASNRLDQILSAVTFRDCSVPVIPNCDPDINHESGTTKDLLVKQLTSPVRWQESIEKMVSSGVRTFIESGPKKNLSGIIRRIAPESSLLNIEDRRSLEKTLESL